MNNQELLEAAFNRGFEASYGNDDDDTGLAEFAKEALVHFTAGLELVIEIGHGEISDFAAALFGVAWQDLMEWGELHEARDLELEMARLGVELPL